MVEDEPHSFFPADLSELTARAISLGERLEIRRLERRTSESPPLIPCGAGGAAAIFRYGAIVTFNLEADEERQLIDELQSRLSGPYDDPEVEEIRLLRDPESKEGVDDDLVRLHAFGTERLRLIAEVLAKSVVLSQYEAMVAGAFDLVEPLAADLRRARARSNRIKELTRHIGRVLAIQQRLVARAQVTEKPELLWDWPELERLYARLEDEYELTERHASLERKLGLISDTATTLLELVHTRRAHRLEVYIIVLIAVEIVLMAYEIFHRGW